MLGNHVLGQPARMIPVLLLFAVSLAHADPIAPSFSTTGSGTVGAGTNYSLGPPGISYGNSFSSNQSGALIGTGTGYGFYDDYVFTITGSSASSVTSTINLGDLLQISGLQARLFSLSGNSSLPVFGAPVGGVIDGWSSAISSGPLTGTVSVIPVTELAPGSYVLEIRGTATGQLGGNYSGVLNLAPVPLPAGLPLLVSGLAALGLGARRRSRAVAAAA